MATLEARLPASGSLRRPFSRSAVRHGEGLEASGEFIGRPTGEVGEGGWQSIIDHQLVEWGRDPSALADDGVTPPSQEIIGLACELAKACELAGYLPPTRVVPDGGGGIAFEQQDARSYVAFLIHADGKVEFVHFKDGSLRVRRRLN